MTRNTVITAVSAAIVLCCAVFFTLSRLFPGSGEVKGKAPATQAGLLQTVPSNAAGVIFHRDAANIADGCLGSGRGASVLDAARTEYAGASALLSYFYLGSTVPLLSLDAGKPSEEALARMQRLSETAESCGFATGKIEIHSGKTSRTVLLLSPNNDLVASAERHYAEGVSILDVSGFRDAAKLAGENSDYIIFNAGSFGALPTGGLLERHFKRRQLNSFAVSYCDWLVLTRSDGGYTVDCICRGDHSAYAKVLADTPDGESRIAEILPENAGFVLDLPISDIDKSLDLRRSNLDARARLASYKDSLKVIARRCGVSPETQARELGIREIARVQWPGGEVLLVRTAKKQEACGAAECKTAGWPALLFGKAFSLPDESCSACTGFWTVIGSSASVESFLSLERVSEEAVPWPAKNACCILKCPECAIVCSKSGNYIELY